MLVATSLPLSGRVRRTMLNAGASNQAAGSDEDGKEEGAMCKPF